MDLKKKKSILPVAIEGATSRKSCVGLLAWLDLLKCNKPSFCVLQFLSGTFKLMLFTGSLESCSTFNFLRDVLPRNHTRKIYARSIEYKNNNPESLCKTISPKIYLETL